jgi:mono/diheme cytochrome c family protein
LNNTLFLVPCLVALGLLGLSACSSPPMAEPVAPAAVGAESGAVEGDTAVGEATASSRPVSFTDAQADRGRGTFRGNCTECHASGDFSDADFRFKWSRRSAGSLYALIQTQMPETAPGSLTPEETVELVSYILRMNGFEPGAEELAPDPDVLDAISLSSIRE